MTAARRFAAPLALLIVLVALALNVRYRNVPTGIDFHTYEAAARVGFQHGWSHIYDQTLVAAEQKTLVPDQVAQPFLSPPTTAWLAALLAPLPYWPSFYIWALITVLALGFALVWSSTERGLVRWVVAGAALSPWWVGQAIHVGQVVPMVAAGVVLAWRLVRGHRDIGAGLALALLFLKPNTAFLVPVALLVAGRWRSVVSLTAVGVVVAGFALLTMGSDGISAYVSQLTAPLPAGANSLTVEGALGVSGAFALGLRVLIVAASLAAAFRLRSSPGLVIAGGVLGSLLVAPYLHGSDLILLGAAAFIVWEEKHAIIWRVPIAAGWLASSPFLALSDLALNLNRWPLVEMVFLAGLVIEAWRPGREHQAPLTGEAELRTRAPA